MDNLNLSPAESFLGDGQSPNSQVGTSGRRDDATCGTSVQSPNMYLKGHRCQTSS